MSTALIAISTVFALAGVTFGLFYRPDLSPDALERDHADAASRFIEVDGVRFHYRDEGEGAPLVLLHGLTANLFVWDALARELSTRFRVIRLDLPGHGLTGPDPKERYAWPEIADSVLRFLDRLDVRRATLIGSSLGGALAWQIAARDPARVTGLILMAPVGYTAGGRLPWPLRLLAQPLIGPLLARFTPERDFVERVRRTYADPARLDRAQAKRQYRLFRRAGNRAALGAILRGGETLATEPLLTRIRAPTLIVWGAADPVLPPGGAQRFARDIATAEVVMIPGAGHVPMLETPDTSAAEILKFLAEQDEAAQIRRPR